MFEHVRNVRPCDRRGNHDGESANLRISGNADDASGRVGDWPAGESIVPVRVWKGESGEAALGVQEDVYVTFPRGQENTLSAAADVSDPLLAPLATSRAVGKLRVLRAGQPIGTYALHPLTDVPEAGLFSRLIDDVKLWLN